MTRVVAWWERIPVAFCTSNSTSRCGI